MPVAPPGTVCGLHPNVPATITSRRCGTFCCPDCLELPSSEQLCVACAARGSVLPNDRTFSLAAVALLASFLGLGCALLAPVGVALSVWLLTREGEKPWKARALPTAALVLGVIALLLAGYFGWLAWRQGGLFLPEA